MPKADELPAAADTLAEGRWLRLVSRGGWEYVERMHSRGVVVIIAITDDGRVVLVEQYRPAMDARVIEPPAGLIGDHPGRGDEDREEAARRELEEETGYRAGALEWLASAPSSPGLARETLHFYRATRLERVGPGGGDDSEDIVVHEVPVAELVTWLHEQRDDGRLVDAKLLASLFFAGGPTDQESAKAER